MYSPESIVIVVTNPLDPLTYLALRIINSDKGKVMGMGGMLDLSRFKEYISSSTRMSPSLDSSNGNRRTRREYATLGKVF